MDAAWSSLSVETHTALCDALSRNIGSMTNQVMINMTIPFLICIIIKNITDLKNHILYIENRISSILDFY